MTIETLRATQLTRIKRAIRANKGPILWTEARRAMSSGKNRGDSRYGNMTIQEWIAKGELTLSWTDFGDSLIGI